MAVQGATGLKLREEEQEPVLVEVEGVLNREAPQELDPHSQRRISALVHVASTAECMSQAEHDEIAAAAWSLAPPSKKRPRDNDGRDINGPDYAANLRLVAEKDSTSSEASSAESQQALLQKTMMQHLLMWQMVQVFTLTRRSAAVFLPCLSLLPFSFVVCRCVFKHCCVLSKQNVTQIPFPKSCDEAWRISKSIIYTDNFSLCLYHAGTRPTSGHATKQTRDFFVVLGFLFDGAPCFSWLLCQSSLLSWTGDSQNDMFGAFNPDVVYNPYVLSMLRFAYIQSHNAAGGVSEGVSVKTEGGQDDGEASTRAKGWRVSDPLPLPSATHTDSAIQEHTGGKNTKEPSHPCSSLPENGEGAVHTGVRGHGAGGGVTSRARVASPTPVMAHRRKPLIHQTPAWLKSGAASRGASHSESVLRAVDETDTDEHAEPALDPNKTDGASARSIAVGQSEVELLTSLRFPATSVSPPRSSNVVIPRLRKPELT